MSDFWGGEKGLARVQQSDKEKDEFCARNNIPLLRIPYLEFDNVDELVAKFIDELIKANETMAAVNAQSNADVEEARTYK